MLVISLRSYGYVPFHCGIPKYNITRVTNLTAAAESKRCKKNPTKALIQSGYGYSYLCLGFLLEWTSSVDRYSPEE